MIELRYDPFPLVLKQGDKATQLACLKFFGLNDSPRAKECQLTLIRQQRSDGAFPSHLDPGHWGLTHLLLSWILDPPRRVQSGYDANDSRVERIMEALAAIQREDGGWRPFWSDESSPIYTVLAIKVLILSGVVTRRDLADDVGPYAHQWRWL